jgi:hypothetical protein
VTISTHTDGRDWARDERMAPTMRELRRLGVEWISIHPYAAIRDDGRVRFGSIDPDRPPAHVVRPIRLAHENGLKILIKPHLAYWGSGFDWRGEIEFDGEAEWSRFWEQYERWIVALAAASREADGFVIGTELDRTLAHDARWRRIIARVREVTPAPLTYAANWSDFERVPFWDALDVIGIQAYFPLTEIASPAEDEIARGWTRWMERLREFSREKERHIVFTELGYDRSYEASVRPWNPDSDGPAARGVQEACLRVALRAIQDEPRVIGAFLWKWFPEPHPVGHDFQLATPGMKRVIQDVWGHPGAARLTGD